MSRRLVLALVALGLGVAVAAIIWSAPDKGLLGRAAIKSD